MGVWGVAKKFLDHQGYLRKFEKTLRKLEGVGASGSGPWPALWDPFHCLDTAPPPPLMSLNNDARRFAPGIGGLGLPVRVFLLGGIPPVGAFVVPRALLSRLPAEFGLLF